MVTVVVGDDTSNSTVRKINIDYHHGYTVMSLTIELNSNVSGGRLPTEAGMADIVPCIGCRDLGYLHYAGPCPTSNPRCFPPTPTQHHIHHHVPMCNSCSVQVPWLRDKIWAKASGRG